MVDLRESNDLRVDTTLVVLLPVVSSVDTARDGTVSVKLSLHLIGTSQGVVLTDVVSNIGSDSEAVLKTVIIGLGWAPKAVTALIHRCALVLQVVGNVLLAR